METKDMIDREQQIVAAEAALKNHPPELAAWLATILIQPQRRAWEEEKERRSRGEGRRPD